MLAVKSYEQAIGFSVMTADELCYVNGGSGNSLNISYTSSSTSTPVEKFFSTISNGATIKSGNFELNIKLDLKTPVTITATWHL